MAGNGQSASQKASMKLRLHVWRQQNAGDAGRFEATLAEYVKSPDVTRQRLYLETMQEVLPQLSRKILLDEKAGQIFPLLQLDQKAK